MYINVTYMNMRDTLAIEGDDRMATARNRSHKHFQLDAMKIKRAQKALRAKTETETIERALDLAIAEEQSNRLVLEANNRFLRSGAVIEDVYGNLDD
jgi:hypothetical protein